jgi:hypothetical protein
MRLTTRHRQHSARVPRISISQEEITADLIYPARRVTPAVGPAPARRKRR